MTHPVEISFRSTDGAALAAHPGRVAVLVGEGGRLPPGLPRPAREAALRALASPAWRAVKPGRALELAFPAGMQAQALQLVNLPRRADVATARKAGAAIGAALLPAPAPEGPASEGTEPAEGAAPPAPAAADTLVWAADHRLAAEVALGIALRAYRFSAYKTAPSGDEAASPPAPRVSFMHRDPEALARAAADGAALAEGVFFTRDLVNEPANVLTTTDFADRLLAMRELGLEVEVLDEDQLARLGMRALLAVGQGSESPSKVVVMRWRGEGADPDRPLALIGKGVVFDSGGISIKPAAGMEEMTMDMGGAAVVAGVLRTLALRRARAHVVGIVGLVENMPDGRAQRPGDILRSMKGDTIEVVNTDAEGRLVLADLLWYAREHVRPRAMVDLATLTGAVIVALGHENAGVFANDDAFANQLLAAARAEGEGAWRLPLGAAYERLIESRLADVRNSGGRPAGSITAAQFLQRFAGTGTPWIHLDIAGVTLPPTAGALAPKGASGWGVMTLNRLVRDRFETPA